MTLCETKKPKKVQEKGLLRKSVNTDAQHSRPFPFPSERPTFSLLFYHLARYAYSQIPLYSEQTPIFESEVLHSLLQCNMTNPRPNERHERWSTSKKIIKMISKYLENVGGCRDVALTQVGFSLAQPEKGEEEKRTGEYAHQVA